MASRGGVRVVDGTYSTLYSILEKGLGDYFVLRTSYFVPTEGSWESGGGRNVAPSSAVSARFDGMEAPDAGRVELRVAGRECLVANYGNAT